MLTIRNLAALAAVLGHIDAALAQGAAWAQCEFIFPANDRMS